MIFSFMNACTVPVKMAFDPPALRSKAFTTTDYIIDIFFFLDIICAFRSTFINDKGEECDSSSEIARSYLKSTFTIDFLATMPFDLVLEFFKES